MTLNNYIPIDLTAVGETIVNVAACKSLWLPKTVAPGGIVTQNPRDAVIGVRFAPGGGMLVFGIQDGLTLVAQGKITRLYVTVLTKGASNVLYLASGSNIGIGAGDIDGLSAQVNLPTFSAATTGGDTE